MIENELMHYGVLGMKWGKRKDRDKSSFNTKYKHVITDKSGQLLQVNGKAVNRHDRMHRKASRAAIKEMNAYRKSNKKANWKDSLSVAGNKYEEVLSGKTSRKEIRKERKAILRDYNNTLRYNKQDYSNKLSAGKLKGNEKDYMTKTYNDMVKKYGKKKLADAKKYQTRVANAASFIGAAAGASLAAILASKGLI